MRLIVAIAAPERHAGARLCKRCPSDDWELELRSLKWATAGSEERAMNEDVLNTSIRRFLKTVGVTSQREIEKTVRAAIASGRIKGNEALPAKITLTVGGIDLTHTIDASIE